MIKTKLTLAKFSESGLLVEQREQKAQSWLKHLMDILYVQFIYNVALAGVNDITPAARTLQKIDANNTMGNLLVGSPPGNVLTVFTQGASWSVTPDWDGQFVGIVVGTNPAAVTPTDDKLGTRIVHGEGAGQLLYGGCELYGLTFADPNGQFTIRRYFTNVLGGGITVQEVGIYAVGVISSLASYIFCIARDVVAPGVTVNNGEILRVTYVPQITV